MGIETHQQANKLDSEAGEKGDIEIVIVAVSQKFEKAEEVRNGQLIAREKVAE